MTDGGALFGTKLTAYSNAYDMYMDCSMNNSVMDCSAALLQYNDASANLTAYYKAVHVSSDKDDFQKVLDSREQVAKMKAKLNSDTIALKRDGTMENNLTIIDTNVIVGICWTILATSIVYVVFIKL